MSKDEAIARLCSVFGASPALADFNIVAVNHILDSLVEAEREACALACEKAGMEGYGTLAAAASIRARGQSRTD